LTKKLKNIYTDKRLIFIICVLLFGLFIFLYFLKSWIDKRDSVLPIDAFFKNKLSTKETIRFKINDSIYFLTLDSNEGKELTVSYRLGLNNISIAFSDAGQFTDDTVTINRRDPGIINVEIDKPTDELGYVWSTDSATLHNFYFFKSLIKVHDDKRIKFAIEGQYLE